MFITVRQEEIAMSLRPRSVPVVATSPMGGRLDVVLRLGQQARQGMTSVNSGGATLDENTQPVLPPDMAKAIVDMLDETLILLVSVVPFSTAPVMKDDYVSGMRVEVFIVDAGYRRETQVHGERMHKVLTDFKYKMLRRLTEAVVAALKRFMFNPLAFKCCAT